MTTLHEQARAEAEKRWSATYGQAAWPQHVARVGAFVQGAEWAATHPRVVTTVSELDALTVGSVVLDRLLMPWHKRPGARWYSTGWDGGVRSPAVPLPARVLYDPEETP